jgi:glucose-6-phosphate 1-dehydrogenase
MTTTQEIFPPCDFVIYGGLGDLSRRKLIISLYRLEKGNFLEPDTRIIAVDRLEEDSASFIKIAYKSLQDFLGEPLDEAIWKKYSARLSYQKMDLTQPEEYKIFNQLTDSSKRVMVNLKAVRGVKILARTVMVVVARIKKSQRRKC